MLRAGNCTSIISTSYAMCRSLKEQIHAIEATIQEDSSGVNSIYNKAEQFSRALGRHASVRFREDVFVFPQKGRLSGNFFFVFLGDLNRF